MRDLRRSLVQHDVAVLRVVAEGWGVDPTGLSQRLIAERLAEVMLGADWPAEWDDMPPAEQEAVRTLLAAGGQMLADPFFRQNGSIRRYGPGRLAREQPWTAPEGPAEALWYRGLLFYSFEETELGTQQVVYLPNDLQPLLPASAGGQPRIRLAPAADAQTVVRRPPAVGLVDDCCTLLAYVQRSHVPAHPQPTIPMEELLPYMRYKERARLEMIWILALEAGLLQVDGDVISPNPVAATGWLRASYPEQTADLVRAWLHSVRWNDLWHVPSLRAEPTGWQNNPLLPRQFMLELLAETETDAWWQLESLPAAAKAARPDFQRTGGEYDSWYLRDSGTSEYLMGYQNWDRVEGALLRYLVTGPLFWLGMTELGDDPGRGVVVFRPAPAGRTFAQVGVWPYPLAPTHVRIQVFADATIVVPATADRFTRFHVARLADWEPIGAGLATYRYRLTPRSLDGVRKGDTLLDRAMEFLVSKSGRQLPDSVRAAVACWDRDGAVVRLGQMTVLQVREEAVLSRLRSAPKVRPFLGEALGPLAVAVRPADWGRLVSAIAELGLLTDVEL